MVAVRAGRVARVAAVLALCGALGCAGHHGRGKNAAAGRSESAAGSNAPVPEAGREPTAQAGRAGTSQPPMDMAGRGPECEAPIGDCFAVLSLAPSLGQPVAADIDGDGELDLIAPGGNMEGSWFELSPTPTHHALGSTTIGSVAYGDVSGDGRADEVGFERLPCGDCEDTLSLIVAKGDGTGRFEDPTSLDTCAVGFSYWRFWLADLNGDGNSEYLLDTRCGDDPEQLRVFDSPFSPWQRLGRSAEALAAADIDDDSRIDIVAIEHPSPAPPRLILLHGEGGLRFTALPMMVELTPEGMEHGRQVQILDLDGDGGHDIAVLGGDAAEHSWIVTLRWSGNELTKVQTIGLEGFVSTLALANTDADCGDELIAFRPKSDSHAMALYEVDPGAGTTRELRFPNPPPELTTVISVPTPTGREHRLFAHTTLAELVVLAPSDCGPPTD